MTNEELVSLIQQEIDTGYNMALLYEQNRGYLHSIAKKYTGMAELDDLMQEAYFGLHDAVKRYQDSGETKFMTYAGYWIKQSLQRYIESMGKTVRLPAHMLQKVQKYRKYRDNFQMEIGRLPTDWECCHNLYMSHNEVKKIQAAYSSYDQIKSLETEIPGTERLMLRDTVPSGEEVEGQVIGRIMEQEIKTGLWEIVKEYTTEEESRIIESRFKIGLSLEETGNQLGIDRGNTKAMESMALRKLRSSRVSRKIIEKYDIVCRGLWNGAECYNIAMEKAYRGTVCNFNYTWTSATEKAAIEIYNGSGHRQREHSS